MSSRPVAVLEVVGPLAADRVDEVVEEVLRGDVADHQIGVHLEGLMSDRVEQVGLAQAGPP